MIIKLFEEKYRDDLIFMVLQAKDALGRKPSINEDLLDIQSNYFDRGDLFWVAVNGEDRVIGCIGYSKTEDPQEAFLHRLYVKAAEKHKGIGSALLQTAENAMRERGISVSLVHLGAPREQWFESYAFYPKRGYREYQPRYMRKNLNEQNKMDNITIRKIAGHEVESAMTLALEVFMEFEAPDYGPLGVETFKRDIVENPEYLENAKNGLCPIYGAFDGDNMVALMGMRSSKTHINLVFTRKAYHRRGIARAIFNCLLNDILAENPSLEALTLNSSPYGLPFYLAIGFIPQSEEQTVNGIRFTPMKYIIKR